MNGDVIIKYAGAPIRLPGLELVQADEATVYPNRPDAYYAAYQAGLSAHRVEVVDREQELAVIKSKTEVAPLLEDIISAVSFSELHDCRAHASRLTGITSEKRSELYDAIKAKEKELVK